MVQNPRQFRIKHFNHPLFHLKVADLLGFLFHFQARQTHFIKLNEASTGSFCISIYKLPLVTKRRREGDSRFLPCSSPPPHSRDPFASKHVRSRTGAGIRRLQAARAVLQPPHLHCGPAALMLSPDPSLSLAEALPNFYVHHAKGMKDSLKQLHPS